MPHVTDDRTLESTTTVGTGPLALSGALAGHTTFATARRVDLSTIQVGDTCWYVAWSVDASGNATSEWEEGLGTYSAAAQLTRTTIWKSSNANAVVSFAAGTKYVAIAAQAAKVLQLDNLGAMWMPAASAEPSAPASGGYFYFKEIAPGHTVAKTMRPSGVDSPIQDDLSFNTLAKWTGSNNAIVAFGAGALTTVGTLAAVTPASGTAKNSQQRVLVPSAATAAAFASVYAASAGLAPMQRGGQNGEGGFRFVARFGLNLMQAGQRGLWGVRDVVTAPTNIDPSAATAPGAIGLSFNLNTGNWNLTHNATGSAPTVNALGANFPLDITSWMELLLFCRPHNGTVAGNIAWRVRRYTTLSNAPAFETSGTISTNMPAATTLLHATGWMTNNATAAAVQWHFGSFAVQRDW